MFLPSLTEGTGYGCSDGRLESSLLQKLGAACLLDRYIGPDSQSVGKGRSS